jgi:hypothetical protein
MAFNDSHPRHDVIIHDKDGNAVSTMDDEGIRRLEISGKVNVIGSVPPPTTTGFVINGDTPLTVTTHDTTKVIPTGEVFHLQEITSGNEDPTKGAVTEVIYDDGTEHLIERVYTNGETISIGYPNLNVARDGTSCAGTGTETIIVRRTKYSGSAIAIDAEIRGYTA